MLGSMLAKTTVPTTCSAATSPTGVDGGVTITRIARDRCIAVRRPIYRKAPATAKPVQLAASGPLSTNEA